MRGPRAQQSSISVIFINSSKTGQQAAAASADSAAVGVGLSSIDTIPEAPVGASLLRLIALVAEKTGMPATQLSSSALSDLEVTPGTGPEQMFRLS